MQIIYSPFTAADFCRTEITAAFPQHAVFADLRFKFASERQNRFVGPGIYAVSFADKLIYIGKYLGKRQDPFSGNVADMRWLKHLGSMTLRDRRVSFSKKAISTLLNPLFPYAEHPVISKLARANDQQQGENTPFLRRDRGCMSTVNRASFGMDYWDSFGSEGRPDLSKFTFHYLRLENTRRGTEIEALRSLISNIEDQLVLQFRPRCNAVIEPGTQLELLNIKAITAQFQQGIDEGGLPPKTARENVTKAPNTNSSSTQNNTTPKASEPEELSAEVCFYDKLADAPSSALLVIDAVQRYSRLHDDVELHFTHTNKGDMRLRRHGLGQSGTRSQNFVTLVWQRRNHTFRINNRLDVKNCGLPEGLKTQLLSNINDPLKSAWKSKPDAIFIEIDAFVSWLDKARRSLG